MGYLISLHDNEVDWNLLGIKVIGVVPTAEDIPEGTYEYGDAYEVGTEPPYDMYIYTRPDGKVHTEGYWFPVGKFPMPGPQGPKGDGLEAIISAADGNIQSVTYDTNNGARVDSTTIVNYVDSTSGMPNSKTFTTSSNMPIVPGKYINIDATADNDAVEVKVDDTALALDYFKIPDKKYSTIGYVPAYKSGKVQKVNLTIENSAGAIVQRGPKGEAGFESIMSRYWYKEPNSPDRMYFSNVYNQVVTSEHNINKSVTNTGTMPALHISYLQNLPQRHIQYNNQVYYRMSPMDAPDGTLNYIHIDSIQDENGGHKATGKCFSINVDTRIWKVFDLDFGGSTSTTDIYRHGIVMNDSDIVVKLDIYDNNSQNYTYEQLKMKLALNPAHCANARIKRSDNTYYYSPATISYWNDSTGNFALTYNNTEGNSVNVNWTPSVVADNGTQIL